MILTITVALFCGMAAGYLFLDVGDKDTLDFILMTALDIMVFIAGIEIGSNRDILKRVCNLHSAVLALSIPAAVAVGSVIGAALIGMAVGLSLYDAVRHVQYGNRYGILFSEYVTRTFGVLFDTASGARA